MEFEFFIGIAYQIIARLGIKGYFKLAIPIGGGRYGKMVWACYYNNFPRLFREIAIDSGFAIRLAKNTGTKKTQNRC